MTAAIRKHSFRVVITKSLPPCLPVQSLAANGLILQDPLFHTAFQAPHGNWDYGITNYSATPLYYLDEWFSSYVDSYDIKTSLLFALSYLA